MGITKSNKSSGFQEIGLTKHDENNINIQNVYI